MFPPINWFLWERGTLRPREKKYFIQSGPVPEKSFAELFSFLLCELNFPPSKVVVLMVLDAKVGESMRVYVRSFTGMRKVFLVLGTEIEFKLMK